MAQTKKQTIESFWMTSQKKRQPSRRLLLVEPMKVRVQKQIYRPSSSYPSAVPKPMNWGMKQTKEIRYVQPKQQSNNNFGIKVVSPSRTRSMKETDWGMKNVGNHSSSPQPKQYDWGIRVPVQKKHYISQPQRRQQQFREPSYGINKNVSIKFVKDGVGIPKSQMNWNQAKQRYPNLDPFGDADKDGVMNSFDCKPFDKYMQEAFKTSKKVVPGYNVLTYGDRFEKMQKQRKEERARLKEERENPQPQAPKDMGSEIGTPTPTIDPALGISDIPNVSISLIPDSKEKKEKGEGKPVTEIMKTLAGKEKGSEFPIGEFASEKKRYKEVIPKKELQTKGGKEMRMVKNPATDKWEPDTGKFFYNVKGVIKESKIDLNKPIVKGKRGLITRGDVAPKATREQAVVDLSKRMQSVFGFGGKEKDLEENVLKNIVTDYVEGTDLTFKNTITVLKNPVTKKEEGFSNKRFWKVGDKIIQKSIGDRAKEDEVVYKLNPVTKRTEAFQKNPQTGELENLKARQIKYWLIGNQIVEKPAKETVEGGKEIFPVYPEITTKTVKGIATNTLDFFKKKGGVPLRNEDFPRDVNIDLYNVLSSRAEKDIEEAKAKQKILNSELPNVIAVIKKPEYAGLGNDDVLATYDAVSKKVRGFGIIEPDEFASGKIKGNVDNTLFKDIEDNMNKDIMPLKEKEYGERKVREFDVNKKTRSRSLYKWDQNMWKTPWQPEIDPNTGQVIGIKFPGDIEKQTYEIASEYRKALGLKPLEIVMKDPQNKKVSFIPLWKKAEIIKETSNKKKALMIKFVEPWLEEVGLDKNINIGALIKRESPVGENWMSIIKVVKEKTGVDLGEKDAWKIGVTNLDQKFHGIGGRKLKGGKYRPGERQIIGRQERAIKDIARQKLETERKEKADRLNQIKSDNSLTAKIMKRDGVTEEVARAYIPTERERIKKDREFREAKKSGLIKTPGQGRPKNPTKPSSPIVNDPGLLGEDMGTGKPMEKDTSKIGLINASSLNLQGNQIRLTYDTKLNKQTLDKLKAEGYKWNRLGRFYFKFGSPKEIEHASTLIKGKEAALGIIKDIIQPKIPSAKTEQSLLENIEPFEIAGTLGVPLEKTQNLFKSSQTEDKTQTQNKTDDSGISIEPRGTAVDRQLRNIGIIKTYLQTNAPVSQIEQRWSKFKSPQTKIPSEKVALMKTRIMSITKEEGEENYQTNRLKEEAQNIQNIKQTLQDPRFETLNDKKKKAIMSDLNDKIVGYSKAVKELSDLRKLIGPTSKREEVVNEQRFVRSDINTLGNEWTSLIKSTKNLIGEVKSTLKGKNKTVVDIFSPEQSAYINSPTSIGYGPGVSPTMKPSQKISVLNKQVAALNRDVEEPEFNVAGSLIKAIIPPSRYEPLRNYLFGEKTKSEQSQSQYQYPTVRLQLAKSIPPPRTKEEARLTGDAERLLGYIEEQEPKAQSFIDMSKDFAEEFKDIVRGPKDKKYVAYPEDQKIIMAVPSKKIKESQLTKEQRESLGLITPIKIKPSTIEKVKENIKGYAKTFVESIPKRTMSMKQLEKEETSLKDRLAKLEERYPTPTKEEKISEIKEEKVVESLIDNTPEINEEKATESLLDDVSPSSSESVPSETSETKTEEK